MHAYLFLDGDIQKRTDDIAKRLSALGISSFDRITPETDGASVGIAGIRVFIKRLMLAPLQGKFSAGIIAQAELLTLEAQQALLKTLEEPPDHAYIFLGAANSQQLIPTILSRCITVAPAQQNMPAKKNAHATDIRARIDELLPAPPGKKIHLVTRMDKSKEEIERFIDAALDILRSDLVAESTTTPIRERKIRLTHRLLNAKKHLAHNVNPQLLLENALF